MLKRAVALLVFVVFAAVSLWVVRALSGSSGAAPAVTTDPSATPSGAGVHPANIESSPAVDEASGAPELAPDPVAVQAAVRSVLMAVAGDVQDCRDATRETVPGTQVAAQLGVKIADGKVFDVVAESDEHADGLLAECLKGVAVDWDVEGLPDGTMRVPVAYGRAK